MGWTNPENPYDPNELDFDYDLFEYNTSVITDANPWMAQFPDVVTELAQSGLSPLDLQREANNMFYHTQANLLFESLPYLSPEQQRVTYNSLNEQAKELLRNAGYIPPAGHQPDWVEKTLGTIGNVATFPLRATLGQIARVPYVGGGFQWGLDKVVKISDAPARLYRTATQMEPWEAGVMVAGAAASIAARKNLAGTTTRLGGMIRNVDAAARTLGRGGVIGANVPFALAGATAAGALTNIIPNGTDFFDAFKRAGNGETLFRREAFDQLDEITQDYDLQNLARNVAFYLDETKLQNDGRTLAEKLALEVAGQPDAHKDQVYANAAGIFLQNEFLGEDDPRLQLFQQALATLLADERFREMVNILQRNKISVGRDLARGLGLEPGNASYTFVSGMTDGVWAWYADPFLAATPYARSAKFTSLNVDIAKSTRSGYGWMWRKRPDKPFTSNVDKRIWLSQNNIRGLGKVDEDIVKALNANDSRLMPEMYREAFFDMKSYFITQGRMLPTGKPKGQITVDELHDFYRSADSVGRFASGMGIVQGLPHQAIWDKRRAPGKRTAFRNGLRTFRGTLSEAQDRARLREEAAQNGINTDEYWYVGGGDYWSAKTGDTISEAALLNTINKQRMGAQAANNFVARIGSFIDSVTTMGQTQPFVDLADPNSIAKMVNGVGVVSRISYKNRETAIASILAENTVAGRRAAVRSFYDTVFEVTGIKYSSRGQQFVDEFIEKAFQGFGYGGNEMLINPALDEVVTRAGLDVSHQSTKLAVPNMKNLSRVVRDDAYMNGLMGVTREGQVLDAAMSDIWKPAVLVRLAFISRSLGEEGLAWLTRGTEFSIMQNIAARQVAKYELYSSVRRKLEQGTRLHQLTPAERGAVSKRLMRKMYPEMERLLTQNGANVSVSRQMLGKTFGAGEHALLTGYENFIRWLQRYDGIPQLNRALKNLEKTHPNLTTLIAGRKGSWTWAGVSGLDNDILVSAQNYVNRHARVMAESLSARSHNQWNTDMGSMDETFIFDYAKGRGKTPIAVAAVGGVRQKVSQADPLYKRGYWEDLNSKFDDLAKGGLYATELLRRAPVEDATYDAARVGAFANTFASWTRSDLPEASLAAESLMHLTMLENDLWRVFRDDLARQPDSVSLNFAEAIDASMETGVFNIDAFANNLRQNNVLTPEMVNNMVAMWTWLEKVSPDMRGYLKALAANLMYAPPSARIAVTGASWEAGAASVEGRRLYMGKTPIRSLWLTEIDEAGNLVIRPARQPQWRNKHAISLSLDPQQALRYSIDSFADIQNPYRGVVFELDADYVAGQFGTTMDDIAANPITYNDLVEEGYVTSRDIRFLNTDHRPHSWTTEVALQPNPNFMSPVDNPTYRELLPIYNEARDIIARLPELVSEDVRTWAWDVRDLTRNWDMSDRDLTRVSDLLQTSENAETIVNALQNLVDTLNEIDPRTLREARTRFLEPSRRRLINDDSLTDLIARADARPADIVDDVLNNFADFVFRDITSSVNEMISFGGLGEWDKVRVSALGDVLSAFSGERFDNLFVGLSPEMMFETFIKQRASSRTGLTMYQTFNDFINNEYVAKPFVIPAGKWRTLTEQESMGMLDEALYDALDAQYDAGWADVADQQIKRNVFENTSLANVADSLITLRNENKVLDPNIIADTFALERRLNTALRNVQAPEEILAEFGRVFDGGLTIDSLRFDAVFGADDILARRENLTLQERIEYQAGLTDPDVDPEILRAIELDRVRTEIRTAIVNEHQKLLNDPNRNWARATELSENVIAQRMPWRYENVLDNEYQSALALFENLFNEDIVGLPTKDMQLVASGATDRVQSAIDENESLAFAANELLLQGIDPALITTQMSIGEALLLDSFIGPQISSRLTVNPEWGNTAFQDAYLTDLQKAGTMAGQGTLPVANKTLVSSNEALAKHLKDQYNLRIYRPEFAADVASTEFSVAQKGMTVAQPVPDNAVRYYFPELRDTNKLNREIENMQLGNLQFDLPRAVVGEDGLLRLEETHLRELVARLVRSQINDGGKYSAILKLPSAQQERLLLPFVEAALYYPVGTVNQVLRHYGTTDPLLADWVTHTLSDVSPELAGVQRGMHQIDIPLAVAKSKGASEWGERFSDVTNKYNVWSFSDAAGTKIEYVNGNILSDGTVGLSPRQAVRNWTDASIDSDFHLFGKGSRETYAVRGEVYQINSKTGELELVPEGTNIETITRQLFDKDGNRLDYNDRRFFEINTSQQEGINFALVGPMIVDYWERQAGLGRVIPTGAADIASNTIIPNKDFVPVRHSRVSHVDFVSPHDRPNLVIGREYTPVKTSWTKRITNNFFENIVGPVLDATVRNPMSFAAYHTSRLAGLRFMNDLVSPATIRSIDETVPVLKKLMNEEGSSFDDLVAAYSQHSNEDVARALAVHQVYSQIGSRDVWDFYRQGVIDFNELKYALDNRFFVDGVNGAEELSWLESRGKNVRAIPRGDTQLTDVLTEEIADAIGTIQKHSEHLDLLAVQNAVRNVVPFIDSAEYRSVFSQRASNMLPFWYAEENFMKRWLRGARSGMYGLDQLVKAQYAIQGLLTTGIVYEENGTYYLNWPGTPLINDMLNMVFGSPSLGTTVRSPVESILPGINPEAGRPTLGPLGTIPVHALTFVAGEIAPSLRDEISQFRRHIMGDIGSTQSWEQQLVPTTLRRAWNSFHSLFSEDDRNTNTMSNSVIATVNLEAAGYGLDPDATPEEQQVFWDRVRAHARVFDLSKLLWGFVLPGSPQNIDTLQNPLSVEGLTGIGLRNPASLVKGEYLRYIQTWGADEGTRRYLADFPDTNLSYIVNPEPYMVSRSQTVSGAPLAPNEENLQWTLGNIEYIQSYPMATLWLAPNKSYEGEWNQYAWADQFSSDLRIMKTPEEIQASIQFQKAAPAYFDAQESYERRRANAEGNQELINLIDADWAMQRDFYLKTHPVFAAQLQDSEGRLIRDKTINEFRVVLYDPDVPASPFIEPVRELFELWNNYTVVQGQLRLDRTTASRETQERNKERMQFEVDQWLLKNPQLESLWLSVFKPETDL